MATVYIPTLLRAATGGQAVVTAEGSTVRRVVEDLERRFPGIAERLVEEGRLRPNVSVAVDGEVTPLGLLEKVTPESEVHFVTAIRGGGGQRET
jgi:molybdopterin synthase sulfur carrier subunit